VVSHCLRCAERISRHLRGCCGGARSHISRDVGAVTAWAGTCPPVVRPQGPRSFAIWLVITVTSTKYRPSAGRSTDFFQSRSARMTIGGSISSLARLALHWRSGGWWHRRRRRTSLRCRRSVRKRVPRSHLTRCAGSGGHVPACRRRGDGHDRRPSYPGTASG
jgi:hypothetical protein